MNYVLVGLIIYLVIILAVVLISGRSRGNEDYLIAERKLGVWRSTMTIMSSKIGSGLIMTYMAYIYLWGPPAIFSFIGMAIGYIVFAFFGRYLKHQADLHGYYTLPEIYRHMFGQKTGLLMGIIIFFVMFGSVAIQLIGGAHIVADAGGISYIWSIIIICGIILFYLLLGGFKSVVATDFLQGICLFTLLPIFLFLAIKATGNINTIDLSMAKEGIRNIPSFVMLGFLMPFAAPELWQRVYAIKNEKTVFKTMLTTALLYTLFGIVLGALGLYLRGLVGNIQPEMLLIAGFKVILPVALASLGTIFMMAAVMSSADTYTFTAASLLVQDIINPLRKKTNSSQTVFDLRIWQVLIMVGALTLGILFTRLTDIFTFVFGIYSIVGSVGIALMIRRDRLNNPFLPLLFGTLAMVVWIIFKGFNPFVAIPALLGTLVGFVVSWLVRLGKAADHVTG